MILVFDINVELNLKHSGSEMNDNSDSSVDRSMRIYNVS